MLKFPPSESIFSRDNEMATVKLSGFTETRCCETRQACTLHKVVYCSSFKMYFNFAILLISLIITKNDHNQIKSYFL